jgi:hypothetical protein
MDYPREISIRPAPNAVAALHNAELAMRICRRSAAALALDLEIVAA